MTSSFAYVDNQYPAWRLMYVCYCGYVGSNNYNNEFVGTCPVITFTSGIRLTESCKTKKGKPVYNIK